MDICKNEGCNNLNAKSQGYSNLECNTCMQVRHKYGITGPERLQILIDQGNNCKICGINVEFKGRYAKKRNYAVLDHCHTNGHIRGVLCNECNVGLGVFKDNIDTLLNAIIYLKETSK